MADVPGRPPKRAEGRPQRREQARRQAQSGNPRDESNTWLRWLVGGVATGGAMIAAGGKLPPWPAMVVWIGAWGAVAYAVFGWSKHFLKEASRRRVVAVAVMRLGLSLLAFWMAFSFWQAGTPEADIQFVKHESFSFIVATNRLEVNIFYANVGTYEATYRGSVVHELIDAKEIQTPDSKQALGHRLRQKLSKEPQMQWSGHFGKADVQFFTPSESVSPEQVKRIYSGELLWAIAGELKYKDWWIRDREPTDFCTVFSATTTAVSVCDLPK